MSEEFKCAYCEEKFDKEDLHLDEDNDYFCEDCGKKCDGCDKWFPKRELYKSGYHYFCEDCCGECAHCNEIWPNGELEDTTDGDYVCYACCVGNNHVTMCLRCKRYELYGECYSLWKWLSRFTKDYSFSFKNPEVKKIKHKKIDKAEKLWDGQWLPGGVGEFTQKKISEWDKPSLGVVGDVVDNMCICCAEEYVLWRLKQLDADGYDADGHDFFGFVKSEKMIKEINNGKN